VIIETWRWRFVVLCIGLGLIWTGGWCVLHPGEVLLNICYSRESVFLQRLNAVASMVAFMSVAFGGGGLVYLVGYSAKKGLAIKEDRKPLDYANIAKTVVAYVLLLIVIGGCVVLLQWAFRGTTLGGAGPPE